jgi:hypothetical protein
MLRIILYALLIWFLYNLIFRFIIPMYRTTKEMKKKFRQMHDQMEEQRRGQQGFSNTPSQPTPKPEPRQSKGDYIDFEEVK